MNLHSRRSNNEICLTAIARGYYHGLQEFRSALFRLFRLANGPGCNAVEMQDLEVITSIRLPPRATFFLRFSISY